MAQPPESIFVMTNDSLYSFIPTTGGKENTSSSPLEN